MIASLASPASCILVIRTVVDVERSHQIVIIELGVIVRIALLWLIWDPSSDILINILGGVRVNIIVRIVHENQMPMLVSPFLVLQTPDPSLHRSKETVR